MTTWNALKQELDRWSASGRVAAFWWRDDDACMPTPALARLLAIAEGTGAPLALAVVPEGTGPALAGRLIRHAAPLAVLQHGACHRNHAAAGEKKNEFPDSRDPEAAVREIRAGRMRLAHLFPSHFNATFAPPWNRCSEAVLDRLASLGFEAVSRFGPRRSPRPHPALAAINTHIDLMQWKPERTFRGETEILEAIQVRLERQRTAMEDADEPTGLLTHHLVHDDACWVFIERLLTELRGHPAAAVMELEQCLEADTPGQTTTRLAT